ncbi:TonB-dependent receptor [Candidatus Margulisiibacteriota bacterium]
MKIKTILSIVFFCTILSISAVAKAAVTPDVLAIVTVDQKIVEVTEDIVIEEIIVTEAIEVIPTQMVKVKEEEKKKKDEKADPVLGAKQESVAYSSLFRPTVLQSEELWRIPGAVQVLTAEQIARFPVKDLKDILVYMGCFYTLDMLGNGLNVQVVGRGQDSGAGVLLIVDGMVINGGITAEPDWQHFGAKDIERIEISSPTVPYQMSYDKVVYVFTKGQSQRRPSYNISINGGNGSQESASIGIKGIKLGRKISTSLFLERNSAQLGRIENALYRDLRFTSKTSFELADDLHLSWVLRYSDIDQEYPGDLSSAELAADRTQVTTPKSGAVNSFMGNTLHFDKQLNRDLLWSGEIYSTQRMDDTKVSARPQGWKVEEWYLEEGNYGVLNQLIWPRTRAGKITVGVDHKRTNTLFKKYNTNAGERTTKISDLLLPQDHNVLFLQDQFSWSKKGDLILGVRAETWAMSARETQGTGISRWSQKETARTHFLGVSYLISEKFQVFGNYAQGYKVLPYSMYQNQALKPGGTLRTELGLKYSSNKTFLTKKAQELKYPWQTSLAFYTLTTKDDIFWLENQIINEHSIRRGFEYSLQGQVLAQWNVFLNYNHQWARFSSGSYEGRVLPLAPEAQYSVGLIYFPRNDLSFTFIERYFSEQWPGLDANNNGEQIKAYDVVDMKIDYKQDQLNYFLVIRNVLDRKYEVAATYLTFPVGTYFIPGAPRSWEIGLNYVF